MHKILWDFLIQTDHQISTKRQELVLIIKKITYLNQDQVYEIFRYKRITPSKWLDLLLISKKKKTCNQVDFVVPVDYKGKIKESENIDE